MASSQPTVEVVLKNVCGLLGEGPHWDDATQTLLFVDIDGREMHRYNPSTGQHEVKKFENNVGHVVPRASGGYVIAQRRRLVEAHWDREEVKTIAEVEVGVLTSTFNDGKCDAKGRLWSGTLGCMESGEDFIQGAGALYKLDPDHSVSKQLEGLTTPNGLAWSGDNRTMYFVDSVPRNVYAFDFDLEAGTISNQRTVLTLPGDSGVNPAAFQDGMTIDTDDKLWIACWGGAAIIKFDPHTGKTLQKIDIPAEQVTSVCWGGKNLDELYVTTSNKGKDQLEKYPLAGSLFKVTGLGARGLPANVYQG